MAAPKGNKYAVGNPGGGAPTKFVPENLKIAERAVMLGFTDNELAVLFDVSEMTIQRWKLANQDFAMVLKIGKQPADDRVERSLFMNAVGYEYVTEKPMVVDKEVQVIQYKERVLPNTTAQIFWLKNRRPDLWRDVHRHEIGRPGEFAAMSDEEVARQMAQAAAELVVGDDGVLAPTKKGKR